MRKEILKLHLDPATLDAIAAEVARRTHAAGAPVPRAAVIRDLLARGLRDAASPTAPAGVPTRPPCSSCFGSGTIPDGQYTAACPWCVPS